MRAPGSYFAMGITTDSCGGCALAISELDRFIELLKNTLELRRSARLRVAFSRSSVIVVLSALLKPSRPPNPASTIESSRSR